MSGGLVLGGSYQRQFHTLTNTWLSLRDAEPQYVDSTGGPVHAIKANWVYELPFGQGRKWGAGASGWKNALIGGWDVNGVLRTQSGDRFNYGNFRLVGLSEDEFADLFKFHKVKDAAGLERIYMFPLDFVQQSIVALTGRIRRIRAAMPTASCRRASTLRRPADRTAFSTLDGMCPGTKLRRIVEGPWYFRTDLSFAKRINSGKGSWIEARMDVFNVFDNINFIATTRERPGRNTGQRAVGVGSQRRGDRSECRAGSGRPDHAVQPAIQLVRGVVSKSVVSSQSSVEPGAFGCPALFELRVERREHFDPAAEKPFAGRARRGPKGF